MSVYLCERGRCVSLRVFESVNDRIEMMHYLGQVSLSDELLIHWNGVHMTNNQKR